MKKTTLTTRRGSQPRSRIWMLLLAYLAVCLPVFGAEVNLPVAKDLSSHGVTQADLDGLDAIMLRAIEKGTVTGCSYLVAHKGEIVYRKAHGAFKTDEQVLLASVSKPFAASVIMALAEQGKLDLEDPVERYLPEFKGIRVKGSQSPARPMTIRHVLSHMAGFWGNKGISREKIGLIRDFSQTLEESVKGAAQYELISEPGTKWTYSGIGYCVAGRVAEAALGDQSFEKVAQDALFRPLGMNRTTYAPTWERPFILVGGSLRSTLDDMAVFGQMHLNDGAYNGKPYLSKASVTDQRRLQIPKERFRAPGLGWHRGFPDENGLADLLMISGATGPNFQADRRRQTVTVFLVRSNLRNVLKIFNGLNQHVEEMFPVAKSLPDGPSKPKRQASDGEAPAPTGEVALKWKTTGLRQANSMGGGAAAIPKSGKFRVFVLMGQSNMTGAARAKELKPPYNQKHDRIRIWANGRWEYFVPRVRFGPGVTMAHQLAELWPDDTIGVIKVASGGTGIRGFEKNWSKERADRTFDGKKGSLYKDLMNAVVEAKRISKPEFSGFVWKQGAADGTKKDLAEEYYKTLKLLISDLRTDLVVPKLPVFVLSYMNDGKLLKAVLPHLSDEELRKIRNPAGKPSVKDADLLEAVLNYLYDTNSPKFRKAIGKRPYIATVIAAQNRAGRELPNVTTVQPGELPRIGGGNNHINAEGQIKLGKIAASAVEEFYKAKE